MTLRPAVLLMGSAFAFLLSAQTDDVSGQIRGHIQDRSDLPIAAASVKVTSAERAFAATVLTDDRGDYRVLHVPPGVYDVEVSKQDFQVQQAKNVRVTIGGVSAQDFTLPVGRSYFSIDVLGISPAVSPERSSQANSFQREALTDLPIDRRDYLTFSLLAPGVADSKAMADDSDFRVVQTPNSGLSFYGSNGRGNFVSVDGGEVNDSAGGVRPTITQEAVEEFQVNRSNYSAELGGASGGVINVVSKSGTNRLHGSAFGFFRHQGMDATDPFAAQLKDGRFVRTKPSANRQQFGGSAGFPIAKNKTFGFVAFEGLKRAESSVVSILTDTSIFDPTPDQSAILAKLPDVQAAALRRVLTAPQSTRDLFDANNGVFPFPGSDWRFSTRLDHKLSNADSLLFRYNFASVDESNATVRALVGATRGNDSEQLDSTTGLGWIHVLRPNLVNDARFQWNYRNFEVASLEPYGPQIDIPGYGFFNRDTQLPSTAIERRWEIKDSLSYGHGAHALKIGGSALIRYNYSNPQVFGAGRFTFGALPGGLVSPALAGTSITALQGFNLGLAQTYQQGFGNDQVFSTDPYYSGFAQDRWKVRENLILDFGLRYELDFRRSPLRTDKNNLAPRFSFSWDPFGKGTTVVRGGYGIYYSPIYYQIDYVVNALGEINGFRQVAQVFTSIQSPGPPAANNIFTMLRAQGVIGVPTPTRQIQASDLRQFGLQPTHTGPRPPFSVLFQSSPDYVNPYSQQASLGVEHEIVQGSAISVTGIYVRTLKITRARDSNLLPAPVNPQLGIPVWSPPYFVDPLLAQLNTYESTARAFYAGMMVEWTHRTNRRLLIAANYTFSKATDEVTDFNSDFQANDQTNLRAERALSSFDQRHKFAAYGVWTIPRLFELSPIIRANSGRPFNLLVGQDLNQDHHSTTDRPPGAGRNTGRGPDFWTVDLRAGRNFRLTEAMGLQVSAEAFNLLNRENFASVNNTVGVISGPFNLQGRPDRTASQPLGFTSVVAQRRLQLGLRLSW